MTTTPRAAQLRTRLQAAEEARRRVAGEPTLADERRARWGMDMAAAQGRAVLQGHADYCSEHGHADHTTVTEDGQDYTSPYCARCGMEVRTRRQELAAGQLVRMYPRHAAPFTAEVLDVHEGIVTLTARQGVALDTFTGWTVIKAQATRWDRYALHQDTMARHRAGSWS